MISRALIAFALLAASPGLAARYDMKVLNAELKAPKPGEIRIVFIGDSITAGWIHPLPDKVDGTVRIGRGIAGQTSAQVRARFAEDCLALHPAVVHILVGTNDIAGNGGPMTLDDTRANLSAMASAAQAAGIKVIIGTLLPTIEYNWRPGQQPVPKIAEINAWIRQEAAARNYVLADYFTPLAAPDGSLKAQYSRDGVHPNANGYKIVEAVATAAIADARK